MVGLTLRVSLDNLGKNQWLPDVAAGQRLGVQMNSGWHEMQRLIAAKDFSEQISYELDRMGPIRCPESLRRKLCVEMIQRAILPLLALVCLLLPFGTIEGAAGDEDRILAVAQNMEAAFKRVEDYTCDVEQVFYQDGVENQRYHFKFYFKKPKKIRVDFSHPHPGLTVIYNDDEKDASVIPFRSLPAFRFRFSVDNPLMKTLTGQRINQTDMGYFIDFIFKNLKKVDQKVNDFYEDEERVKFLFWALDYIEDKSPEKYRISISKNHWAPIRIERYSLEDKLLESSDIKGYVFNSHLEDKFFLP